MGDELGGRPKPRECYDADGKVLYDKVEEQEFYRRGIDRLLDGIARFRVCLMCAEEDPSHCHRRLLIAQTLTRHGVEVRHVRGSGIIEPEVEVQTRSEAKQLPLLSMKGSGP